MELCRSHVIYIFVECLCLLDQVHIVNRFLPFEESDYTELGRLKSDRNLSEDEIWEGFANLIHKAGLKENSFDGSVLSSVVSEMTDKTAGALKKITRPDRKW